MRVLGFDRIKEESFSRSLFFISFIASFFCVSLGQKKSFPFFSFLSSSVGYAFFWFFLCKSMKKGKERYWTSVLWFFLVESVQLFWFTSTKYMGPYILLVYVGLIFFIALQFGFLSTLFETEGKKLISLKNTFVLASLWTVLEYLREFYFSGFTWNPAGLSYSSSIGISFASLFGMYGLSFWVMWVNSFFLYSWGNPKRLFLWGVLALIPYLYGLSSQMFLGPTLDKKPLSVALVQTALFPEEKDFFPSEPAKYIPALHQWERIWGVLDPKVKVDLIVLPEASVTHGAADYVYPMRDFVRVWESYFGAKSLDVFPDLDLRFGKEVDGTWWVNNLFISQGLSNYFGADLIAGFDLYEGEKNYNAAFHFSPESQNIDFYKKRVLVPGGEYIPISSWQWASDFLRDEFGIGSFFSRGNEVKIFSGPFPLGVSICCEEVYPYLIRDFKKKGAHLLVNISNDVWFPSSSLPMQHFQHGCIRSAENGLFSLRATNTGVTSVIDCFGKSLHTLKPSEDEESVLYADCLISSYATPYSFWGDFPILGFSLTILLYTMSLSLYDRKSVFQSGLKL